MNSPARQEDNKGRSIAIGLAAGGLFGLFLGLAISSLWGGSLLALFVIGPLAVFLLGVLAGIGGLLSVAAFRDLWRGGERVEPAALGQRRRPSFFRGAPLAAAGLCLLIGAVLGSFVLGFSFSYPKRQIALIERNFGHVRAGMTSGEALKTIFAGAYVFPEGDGKWPIWNYDILKSIRCRMKGSSPFTLTIDTVSDKVIKAGYEYNTNFD